MSDNTSDLIPQIDLIRANPIVMQRMWLQRHEAVTGGEKRIVDPTTPFSFLMESSCANASAGMLRNETLNRKQYPSVAISDEDLYLHMSDRDYLNRFSSPAGATFSILLLLEDVKSKAVLVPNTGGVKKMTIPRHTEFTVADISFTMQYPIEIRVQPHGGLIVTYDTTQQSPLYTRESNSVDWYVTALGADKYLRLNIPVTQFAIQSVTAQMNAIVGFTKSYTFTDNFYYCRAFHRANGGAWVEIKTTHTDQVYDPMTPTVALKVVGQRLIVNIPQIYFNNTDVEQRIRDVVRIDIYTTKGPMSKALTNYLPDQFTAKWTDLDEDDNRIYSAPLDTFSGLSIFSADTALGGTAAISFEELRDRVVNRRLSSKSFPITNAQLETVLKDLGYELVVNVDNITNRQFLATREIPLPDNKATYTGAGCTIQTLQKKMSELSPLPTVADNGSRITIKPSTVFRNTNGVLSIVDNAVVQGWLDPNITTLEQLAAIVNNDDLLYTPFYYVLDASGNHFDVRPYRLDKPEVLSKYFQNENENMNIEASTIGFELVQGINGYIFFVELKKTPGITALPIGQLKVQLSYKPTETGERVFFEGTYLPQTDADRRIFMFELNTNYDINSKHELILTDSSTPTALRNTFDLAIIALDYAPLGAGPTDVDTVVDATAYPLATTVIGISHERFQLKFGDYLENLWVRSRSFVDNLTFDTYPEDVLATYQSNVFERDIYGNVVLVWNITTLEYEYNVLHWAGEPVLNVAGEAAYDAFVLANPAWPTDNPLQTPNIIWDWILSLSNADRQTFITNIADIRIAPNSTDTPLLTGAGTTAFNNWKTANPTIPTTLFHWWLNNGPDPAADRWDLAPAALTEEQRHDYSVIKHAAGTNILDEFGQPSIAGGGDRGILRQADILFIDAKYFFASDAVTVAYRQEVIDKLVTWVTEDIASISKQLIEQSKIYLYPKSNRGYINVFVGEGEKALVKAEQKLVVIHQVTADVYSNPTLLNAIEESTIKTLAENINANRISHSGLIAKLQAVLGDNVISTILQGFMEDKYKVVSVVDNASRPAVGKVLVVQNNRTTTVDDSVDVQFIRHK